MQLVEILYCLLASLSQQIHLCRGPAVLLQDLLLRMCHAFSKVHISNFSLVLVLKLFYLFLEGQTMLVWLNQVSLVILLLYGIILPECARRV